MIVFLLFQNLCMDLENRQFTLDTVNKKVETILPDLSARDREEMEQSLHALGSEHQRVYEVAIAQKNLLAESLNTREVFQVGLERVELWLHDRETSIANLEKLRLTAADVEKQAEKAKVRCMVIVVRWLERVDMWLLDRETGIANLKKLGHIAADVEKQAEKAKVRFMVTMVR